MADVVAFHFVLYWLVYLFIEGYKEDMEASLSLCFLLAYTIYLTATSLDIGRFAKVCFRNKRVDLNFKSLISSCKKKNEEENDFLELIKIFLCKNASVKSNLIVYIF